MKKVKEQQKVKCSSCSGIGIDWGSVINQAEALSEKMGTNLYHAVLCLRRSGTPCKQCNGKGHE